MSMKRCNTQAFAEENVCLAGRNSTEDSESSILKGGQPRETHSRQEGRGHTNVRAGHSGKQAPASNIFSPVGKGPKAAAGRPQPRRGKHAPKGTIDESTRKKDAPVPADSADEAELEKNLSQVRLLRV